MKHIKKALKILLDIFTLLISKSIVWFSSLTKKQKIQFLSFLSLTTIALFIYRENTKPPIDPSNISPLGGTYEYTDPNGGIFDLFGLGGKNKEETPQKTIQTVADYKELEQTLLTSMEMGMESQSGYSLGTLYLTDFKLEDGNIDKDIEKAKYFFNKSLNAGNYSAAYNLAMIDVYNKDYDSALMLLDNTLTITKEADAKNNSEQMKYNRVFLASTFASIVLEHEYDNKEAVNKAILYLDQLASVKYPTTLFLLANLYNVRGDENKANLLLNMACGNTNNVTPDPQVRELCNKLRAE
ncbi:hypothetical protein [Aquamicrobium sp.]|uniref:hypothetical protein n=1 Tax=Aquamicrobium sp. TaxID=1872579 RepID=UPI0025875BAC|nr:hypothetical protein [Aquamicrobium sp.]MCK9549284.1 hypothetical protein [Aquamicrobium sp.]